MNHPALKGAERFLGRLDGIIGFPLFSRYHLTIDYQRRELTLEPVAYQGHSQDLMMLMMAMMMNPKPKPAKKIQSPTTLWGFRVAKGEDDEKPGVTITKVWPGTPAAAAGLRQGDRLLVLDGVWTDSVPDLYRAAEGVRAGQKVRVQLRRGERDIETTITPRAGM